MTIKLENLVKKMKLEVINKSSDYSNISIENDEINRPGLQ